MNSLRKITTCFALTAAFCCGATQAQAQGQPVDRGTGDLGPNSVSQRVVHPGIGQFSAEGALTDRYADAPATRLASLYHQPDTERRYLYRAPGVTALYNQSDYITRDAQGVSGINRSSAGNGQTYAIAPADIIYVLSPDLLFNPPTPQAAQHVPGQVDRRLDPTPLTAPRYHTAPDGQLDTRIDGQIDPENPRILDLQAIHSQRRGAQRDPRLVERSRRWREEAEREAQAQRDAEDSESAEDMPAEGDAGAGGVEAEAQTESAPPE